MSGILHGMLIQCAAFSPGNVTEHGRVLLQHDFLRAGSFCLGGKLAPLTFLLGCQRCGTNSLYEDIIGRCVTNSALADASWCHRDHSSGLSLIPHMSTCLPALAPSHLPTYLTYCVHGARPGHALRGEPEYYSREQHFFATDTWSKGAQHYLSHFPDCPGHSAGFQFAIDATPAYLRKPIVAEGRPTPCCLARRP